MKPPTTDNQIAIKLVGVTKKYTIHHEKPTLVERLTSGRDEEFWAFKNISLIKSFSPLGQSPFS